jgi:hypothetical protein
MKILNKKYTFKLRIKLHMNKKLISLIWFIFFVLNLFAEARDFIKNKMLINAII